MGNTCGKLSGKEAFERGYGSPGIVRNSGAAHDMSKAMSSGRGMSTVSYNQSVGAKYANSIANSG